MDSQSGSQTPQPGPDAPDANPKAHLLIAGSGRAGTSFLVRYLSEIGLDTHLTRHGPNAWMDEAANAGLEDIPLSRFSPDLPYVVKSPWAFELIDEVLADPNMHLDGVIIPVRDLEEAASSRVILEQRALAERSPSLLKLRSTWHHVGPTPGGVLASLEPLDQARILATGFHHLIQRLVSADVPIRLVAFPRLVIDANYLFQSLQGLLPAKITRESAIAAHERIADPQKVRVGSELARLPGEGSRPTVPALERIALARENERLRAQIAAAELERCHASEEVNRLSVKISDLAVESEAHQHDHATQIACTEAELDRLRTECIEQKQRIDQIGESCAQQKVVADRLAFVAHEQQMEIRALREQLRTTKARARCQKKTPLNVPGAAVSRRSRTSS